MTNRYFKKHEDNVYRDYLYGFANPFYIVSIICIIVGYHYVPGIELIGYASLLVGLAVQVWARWLPPKRLFLLISDWNEEMIEQECFQ